MHFRRVSLHRFCWLALVALLALASLPTVSHALSAAREQSPFAEICTTQSTRWTSLNTAVGNQGTPASPSLHLEHCPFCSTHFGALGMPSAPAAAVLAAPDGIELPERFLHAPRTLYAWRSAQPRAPPISS